MNHQASFTLDPRDRLPARPSGTPSSDDRRDQVLTGCKCLEVGKHEIAHGQPRVDRSARDMRGQDSAIAGDQFGGHIGFIREDVKRRPGDGTRGDRLNEGGLVDHRTASDTDQKAVLAERIQDSLIDDGGGRAARRRRDDQDLDLDRKRHRVAEIRKIRLGLGDIALGDLDIEANETPGDRIAYVAEAENAETQPQELPA